MSVQGYLSPNIGNRLFEYNAARIFAEKYGLNLIMNLDTDGIMTVNQPKVCNNQVDFSAPKIITAKDINQFDEIIFSGKINYYFRDYFQNANLFRPYRNLIKSYYQLDPVKINYDDLVIHFRLRDFMHPNNISEVIHPESYIKILEDLKGKYRLLYIVVEKPKEQWEIDYLQYFNKYQPIIISGTIKEDFNFIRSFSKIIISNSTFCYWAAFLSDSVEIYCFNKMGYFEDANGNIKCHGAHIKDLDKIIDGCTSYDMKFYHI
jgi:hypothetical protein